MRRVTCLTISCMLLVCAVALGDDSGLPCKYTVVKRYSDPENKAFGLWAICTKDTTNLGWQLVARCAARELNEKFDTELTSVFVIPKEEFVNLGIKYAGARYSANGRGSRPLGERFHTFDWYWREFVVERPLTDRELCIAELWVEHERNFPMKNLASSNLYDHKALREFIANELEIEFEEAKLPELPTRQKVDQQR